MGRQGVALDAAARADAAAEYIVGVQVVSTLEGRRVVRAGHAPSSNSLLLPLAPSCPQASPTATLVLPLPSLSLPPSFSLLLICPSFSLHTSLSPSLSPLPMSLHLPCLSSHLTLLALSLVSLSSVPRCPSFPPLCLSECSFPHASFPLSPLSLPWPGGS